MEESKSSEEKEFLESTLTSHQPQKKIADRVTVVETIYHQVQGEQPTTIESRYSRNLKTDEQLYQRRFTVTEDWVLLDLGWAGNNISLLHISNEEGKFPHKIPTPEEIEEVARRVIEVSYAPTSGMGWSIPPGESIRGIPTRVESLFLRCVCGKAKCVLTLVPE